MLILSNSGSSISIVIVISGIEALGIVFAGIQRFCPEILSFELWIAGIPFVILNTVVSFVVENSAFQNLILALSSISS